MFSWNTTILGHDGHMIFDLMTEKCINNTVGDRRDSIVIGDHVWVGGETAILPETTIESGSICGYKSVVKGHFPNNCVIVGIPARVVKKNIAWSRENICNSDVVLYKLPVEYRQMTD